MSLITSNYMVLLAFLDFDVLKKNGIIAYI